MSSAPAAAEVLRPEPLVEGGVSLHEITNAICAPVEQEVLKTPIGWTIAFLISLGLLGVFGLTVGYLVYKGIGIWGNNQPVGWAWDITNFVWWIGIGHAGTLISAILLLMHQKWRTSLNRFAEADVADLLADGGEVMRTADELLGVGVDRVFCIGHRGD